MTGRAHGRPPYRNVVVHGGPGAPGSAYGIACLLSSALEPFQTQKTVLGQIDELAESVRSEAEPPVVLIGHSWGAMLALLTAAAHRSLFSTVVLVCSGGFSADAYQRTSEVRLSRLPAKDRERALVVRDLLKESPDDPQAGLTEEYYRLISQADAFDPDPEAADHTVAFQNDVNKCVWREAVALRESGELLERISGVACPVVALHGDYDPHPVECVAEPLTNVLQDFRMVVLPECGHEPWNERRAREEFKRLLQSLAL